MPGTSALPNYITQYTTCIKFQLELIIRLLYIQKKTKNDITFYFSSKVSINNKAIVDIRLRPHCAIALPNSTLAYFSEGPL